MADPTDPMGNAVAGSADLQASLDRLDHAVLNLTSAINGQTNGNGTVTSPAMAAGAGGATFTTGTFAGAGGGSASFAGGVVGGNNGSGGTSGTNPFSFGGSGGFNLAQGAFNVGTKIINGQFAAGAQQLGNQAVINTYGYTQAGFWNTSSQSTIRTAFGGGNGRGLSSNNLAVGAGDARSGASILSQLSGQANYTAGASGAYGRGNAIFQLAATTGMANPGLGMTNSAGISSAWYNPSTSYNLMMMGIGATPLQLGTGKANSMTGVEAAIGQRFGFEGFNSKTGTFNSQNLAANLDNPLFMQQIMSATGMNQQQYQTWAQQWAQMNTWALKGHTTMNQMQNEVSQYMNGSASQQHNAQKWLTSHGVSMSLLQSMTQSNALQTGAEAGGNAAFTKGLEQATSVVNQFTEALSKGLQKMAGTTGAAAAIGSLNTSGVVGAGSGATSAGLGGAISAIQHGLTDLTHLAGLNSLGGITNPGGSTGASGGSGAKVGSPVSSSAKANQALGQRMAVQYGWTSANGQWQALNQLMMNESGWITNNQNPSSSAFGIGQFLDSTWGIYDSITKAQANNNPTLQIKAMLDYVKGRWGSPANAMKNYSHQFLVNGRWVAGYADGSTSTKPGLALVGERGPELVSMSGGQQIINAAQTARMLQPSFGASTGSGSGGVQIIFQSGAITLTSTNGTSNVTGYHTSGDVQTNAAQLVQAVETALSKSAVLKNIAAGVTG